MYANISERILTYCIIFCQTSNNNPMCLLSNGELRKDQFEDCSDKVSPDYDAPLRRNRRSRYLR